MEEPPEQKLPGQLRHVGVWRELASCYRRFDLFQVVDPGNNPVSIFKNLIALYYVSDRSINIICRIFNPVSVLTELDLRSIVRFIICRTIYMSKYARVPTINRLQKL